MKRIQNNTNYNGRFLYIQHFTINNVVAEASDIYVALENI